LVERVEEYVRWLKGAPIGESHAHTR
jgi:hypothetical protein